MERLKRIVIKISGSIFYWRNIKELPKIADIIKKYVNTGQYSFVLVAGGGETARKYISAGRSFGGNEGLLDEMGLRSAQLNAYLLICLLNDLAYQLVPSSLDECIAAVFTNKVVVAGGLHPGHSTNAVAALIAERAKADLFINATDVEGVYSSDPKRSMSARKLDRIHILKLKRMIQEKEFRAGSYELMDLVAVNIIERAKIKTRIIKCDPVFLERAILGKSVGTEVVV